MASTIAADPAAAPLYPPTVQPPPVDLGLARYLLAFARNPLSVMPQAVYQEPIVQYGTRRTYVMDPQLVKRVLLDDRESYTKTQMEERAFGGLLGKSILIAEGRDWRWQRQTAAPVFRHADILQYAPTIVAAAEVLVSEWRASPSGTTHPIDDDMTRVTFRVIAETMLHGGGAAGSDGLERSNQAYVGPISWTLLYGMLGWPSWLPYPGRTARLRAERGMRSAVDKIVQARRGSAANDMLARLLQAKSPDTGEAMSNVQVVDNLLTFLLAGHETTARALSWALYLVARAPAWERRILDEVARVAGDGPIAPEHIERLTETTKVIKEAMRLYPPISSIGRLAARDLELGGKQLTPGSLVILPVFAIHRHRQLWDDPDRFDPDRFAPEREATHSRYQFMPFGAGPRICIGASFAMMEAVAMLATFLRAAHFEVPDGHVPVPVSGITLRPTGGMPLKVSSR